MSSTIHPVILCGGSGTRLWPVSRKAKPKPFLPLLGERTLFQEALDRVSDRDRFAAPVVVTGADHLPFVEEQSSDAGALSIIVEPAARNTAPAIALAAARLPAKTACCSSARAIITSPIRPLSPPPRRPPRGSRPTTG